LSLAIAHLIRLEKINTIPDNRPKMTIRTWNSIPPEFGSMYMVSLPDGLRVGLLQPRNYTKEVVKPAISDG
jgi:hypothetical protein